MTDAPGAGEQGRAPGTDQQGRALGTEQQDGWRRLHPLSPLLRGGVMVAAAGAWLVSNQLDTLFGNDSELPGGRALALVALAAVLFLLLVVLGSWLSWRVSRFRVGPTSLEVRTGLLFRQHRQVRHDRVQAIDVTRPLLARLVGVSEVRVRAAGTGSDVRLAFLADSQARAVRDRLAALAGRSDELEPAAGDRSGAPGADGRPAATPAPAGLRSRHDSIVRVPAERLVQAALYSGQALSLLAALVLLAASAAVHVGPAVPAIASFVLAVGGRRARQLVREWNFDVARQPDGIRVRHGLTELHTSSIPAHRIQAVQLRQPLLWRLPGWWRVEINVAGVAVGKDGDAVALPVGTRDEALEIVRVVRPATDLRAVRAGLVGGGTDGGYLAAPARARWLAPVVGTRHGAASTGDALLVRSGRLCRVLTVVPHARTQSLTLRQEPFERVLGLASLRLLSTPGPADPWVRHLDAAAATALLNAQVARSSRARALANANGPDFGDSVALRPQT